MNTLLYTRSGVADDRFLAGKWLTTRDNDAQGLCIQGWIILEKAQSADCAFLILDI